MAAIAKSLHWQQANEKSPYKVVRQHKPHPQQRKVSNPAIPNPHYRSTLRYCTAVLFQVVAFSLPFCRFASFLHWARPCGSGALRFQGQRRGKAAILWLCRFPCAFSLVCSPRSAWSASGSALPVFTAPALPPVGVGSTRYHRAILPPVAQPPAPGVWCLGYP